MRIAIIPPTSYLEPFAKCGENKYHMALAHRVLSDHQYADFYKNCSRKGHYVILDNGACELGESIAFDELTAAIHCINAAQIVLPDKLNDASKTLRMTYEFISKLEDSEIEIDTMAVVQGRSKAEWLDCFVQLASIKSLTTIGISSTEAVFPSKDNYYSRVKTIEFLVKAGLIPGDKTIHLLGLPDSGHLEIKKLKKYPFIEGVDSSAPVVHGFYGIRFCRGRRYKKIRKYLSADQQMNDEQIQAVIQNIKVLKDSGT